MIEKSPTVYVPQEPRFRDPKPPHDWKTVDMVSLLDYGTVEVLLEAGEQVTFNAAATVRRIAAKVMHYREQDFVVAAGDPVAIMLTGAFAAIANRGVFTILKWDRLEKRYFPVKVNMRETA